MSGVFKQGEENPSLGSKLGQLLSCCEAGESAS